MEEALRQALTDSRSAKRDYAELFDQFQLLAVHAKNLQRSNEVLTEKSNKWKKRGKEYMSQRQAFEDDVTHLEMATKLLEKREKDIEDAMSAMRDQLLQVNGLNALLEKDNEELRRTMDNDMIHINNHYEKLRTIEADYRVLMRQHDILKVTIDNDFVKKEEFVEAINTINEANCRASVLEKQLEQIRRKEAEGSGSLQTESERATALASQVTDLQAQLLEAQNYKERHNEREDIVRASYETIAGLEGSKAALLTQLGHVKNELRRERDSLRPFQEQVEALKQKIIDLENDCSQRTASLTAHFTDRLSIKEKESVVLATSNQELERRVQGLDQENAELRSELAAAHAKVDTLLSQKTEAENICEELYGKRIALDAKLSKSADECIQLRKALLAADEEVVNLQSQINEFKFVHCACSRILSPDTNSFLDQERSVVRSGCYGPHDNVSEHYRSRAIGGKPGWPRLFQ
jgi:chromosome segregation ATPase